MYKLILIFIVGINIYANENKIMSDKFNVLEENINKIEQKNILLENENIKLIEKIQAFDTHNKYIETTYTTIINTNQNKLDNFLWILASIIAVLGLFGFSAVSKYINTKLNEIISKKQNELDVLIENVKNLEKGLKFEYLQKLAEFSQHNKKSGETTQAEKIGLFIMQNFYLKMKLNELLKIGEFLHLSIFMLIMILKNLQKVLKNQLNLIPSLILKTIKY